MTLYQFNQLDEMEQIVAFWDGVFVVKLSKAKSTLLNAGKLMIFM